MVASTRSHSSCFMRANRLSLAMPALFTRIVGSDFDSESVPKSALTEEGSATFSVRPRASGETARNLSEIWAAPASVVAVPTTSAPCSANARAVARPIPREAPVTRATRPSIPGQRPSCSISMRPVSRGWFRRDYTPRPRPGDPFARLATR